MKEYLFLTKYGRMINIYFSRHFAWLKYFTYHLLVPVLAPNYKQHILSPAKVEKVYYSSPEPYVTSVYLNLSGRGGVKFKKNFKGRARAMKV
jgi:hypothetical protein